MAPATGANQAFTESAEAHEHPMRTLVIEGTADPSAGAGVAADVGTLYCRNASGTGSAWVKVGAADTAWTELALAV